MQVRCISPHGGARHGTDGRGNPVGPDYNGPRQLQPHPDGYVVNTVLGVVAVGDVVEAPDSFTIDGFHFEAAEKPPKPPVVQPPAPAAVSPPAAAPATPAGTEGN